MNRPEPARLPGLDALRALAILAVMSFHLSGSLPESFHTVTQFGWMGVDLFFVLSGFLIGSQLLRSYLSGSRPSLLNFYRRRAWRILPAYSVVLALYFLWPSWREDDAISPLWQFLTFTENLFVNYSIYPAFSHVWSLCVEEHFYLILPLLVLLLMRKPSPRITVVLLSALVVLGIGLGTWVLLHTLRPLGVDNFGIAYIEHIYYPTWTRLDGLLIGVTLAMIKTFRPHWWFTAANRGHSTLAAGLILIGVSMRLFIDRFGSLTGAAAAGTIIGFPLLSLGLGFLVASSISRNGWLARFRIPGARLIATLAFSLYLSHKAIAHLDRLWFPAITDPRGAAATLLYAFTCVTFAAILYLCVEHPCLLIRDRLRHVRTTRPDKEILTEQAL